MFISHSSKDKPFVRRLAKKLWSDGYDCWIDEAELVPGDMLSMRLSEAIKESRVVIVVVTEHSLKSKWLKFELNKATEFMVDGECRVIPIVIGEVEPPDVIKGHIYADFRKAFAVGYKAVLAALKKEADEAIQDSWQLLPSLIQTTFDKFGSSSGGDYERIDYEFVQINGLKAKPSRSDNECIVYDVIHDYAARKEPLDSNWWREYLETQERNGELYHLVVTERPIGIRDIKPSCKYGRISSCVDLLIPSHPSVVVFADVGDLNSEDEKLAVILDAKKEIEDVARRLGHLPSSKKSRGSRKAASKTPVTHARKRGKPTL